MGLSKASALRLASDAMRDGATALRGRLVREEDGRFKVDGRDLSALLDELSGLEAVIIVAPLDEAHASEVRQCGTCGREYEGPECPHCASARRRLRGR